MSDEFLPLFPLQDAPEGKGSAPESDLGPPPSPPDPHQAELFARGASAVPAAAAGGRSWPATRRRPGPRASRIVQTDLFNSLAPPPTAAQRSWFGDQLSLLGE